VSLESLGPSDKVTLVSFEALGPSDKVIWVSLESLGPSNRVTWVSLESLGPSDKVTWVSLESLGQRDKVTCVQGWVSKKIVSIFSDFRKKIYLLWTIGIYRWEIYDYSLSHPKKFYYSILSAVEGIFSRTWECGDCALQNYC
jgi:hypothetical protein